MKGFNCLLYVGESPVGAQINADLRRSTSSSDITNMIEMDWEETLPRLKSWGVNCNGMYMVDNDSFNLLEEAYFNSSLINVKLQSPSITFEGEGYITSFPVGAAYNDGISYNITIQGSGPLTRV